MGLKQLVMPKTRESAETTGAISERHEEHPWLRWTACYQKRCRRLKHIKYVRDPCIYGDILKSKPLGDVRDVPFYNKGKDQYFSHLSLRNWRSRTLKKQPEKRKCFPLERNSV